VRRGGGQGTILLGEAGSFEVTVRRLGGRGITLHYGGRSPGGAASPKKPIVTVRMRKKSALVVFDMDGVLIDVSSSYREVVRLSVAAYLRTVLGADSLPGDFITLTDVDAVKKNGGFNNDWDLTYAVIDLLLRRYFDAPNGRFTGPGTAAAHARLIRGDEEKLRVIRSTPDGFDTRALIAGARVKPVRALFAEDTKESSGSGGPQDGGRRGGGQKSPFLYNEGDVGTGNLVKRIFQELYLGPALFEEIYGMKTIFDRESSARGAARRGQAFIDRESLIPSTAHLVELESLGGLAVATGRPRVEAVYPLKKFGIAHLFKALVSEDDVVEAEKAHGRPLRKPDPFSVALAIERSGAAPAGHAVFYVGDMPGDVTAALGAGARPVGFVDERRTSVVENAAEERARHPELLLRAGAEAVFSDYDELVRYVKNAM
jgi:phosphoglycolate phosphatase-like HAD superfamily hydrolase